MKVDSTIIFPITKLNSYCLDKIFGFLGLKDQLSLATTNSILHDAYLSYLYWHKKIVINDDVCGKDLPKLLKFCQGNVKELKSIVANCRNFGKQNYFLTDLEQYILTLLELKLSRFYYLEPIALHTLLRVSNLKVLQLSRCNLSDLHCYALQNCKNLEVLDLSENYAITGRFLNNFENLVELNLNYCKKMSAFHFATLIRVSYNLERVHIAYCKDINEITLRGLTRYLANIKAVTVSDTFRSKKIHILLRLPKLEHVEIYGLKNVKPFFFTELSRLTGNKLRILKIVANKRDRNYFNFENLHTMYALTHFTIKNYDKLNDECILNLANLDKLIYLNVTGCKYFSPSSLKVAVVKLKYLTELDISLCEQITSSFIEELSKELQSVDSKRKIILYNTVSNEDLKEQIIETSLKFGNIYLITRLASPTEENPCTTEFYQFDGYRKIRS